MARHAYNDHLKKVSLFADLDDDDLDMVARCATQLDYPAGKVLMIEGATAHEMFVVVEGEVEVTREGEHIADLGPGSFVGEMSLLTHTRRNSTVTTKTSASVLHVDGRGFTGILREVPAIGAKMLPVVAARAAQNSQHDD
ncbi:MAG TPA: cyclic nucleotide-binding domain-containing protein [Ilumatobacter sp.]